jgi:hypothetical protein
VSDIAGRKYSHYFLRADPAGAFHWRWSLVIPTAGGTSLDGDEPRLQFKGKTGGTGVTLIQPFCFSRERLADIIVRTQRLTLPADAPVDAVFTLEKLEMLIQQIRSQSQVASSR